MSQAKAAHYQRDDLLQTIDAAIVEAGGDPNALTPRDLAAIDEFHIRGKEATRELLEAMHLKPGSRVLDLGCGLGGTARSLALHHGCEVVGLDFTAAYIEVARELTERLSLSNHVRFEQGNALLMPFEDKSFDAVISQHMVMNIADKRTLVKEIKRVLKPGGQYGAYEVFSGTLQTEPYYPVPWASQSEHSHLVSGEDYAMTLAETGMRPRFWREVTTDGELWFDAVWNRIKSRGLPPLSLETLLGDQAMVMLENQYKNLRDHKISLVQLVYGA